jgi:hypothetical protein
MGARPQISKGISSWPEEERPRERLLSCGPQALTDAELVAILIRVGFKGTSAVELARHLIKRFGSLRAMVQAPVLALLEVKGLKGAKAAQLLAAMEIARRIAVPTKRAQFQIKSTSAVADYLWERLRGLLHAKDRLSGNKGRQTTGIGARLAGQSGPPIKLKPPSFLDDFENSFHTWWMSSH